MQIAGNTNLQQQKKKEEKKKKEEEKTEVKTHTDRITKARKNPQYFTEYTSYNPLLEPTLKTCASILYIYTHSSFLFFCNHNNGYENSVYRKILSQNLQAQALGLRILTVSQVKSLSSRPKWP